MLSLQEQTRFKSSPKIYEVEELPDCWVAEGTDGGLYVVPKQPGSWMRYEAVRCDDFKSRPEILQPLSIDEARSVVWFVYGDVGRVVIAEG